MGVVRLGIIRKPRVQYLYDRRRPSRPVRWSLLLSEEPARDVYEEPGVEGVGPVDPHPRL